MKIRKKKKISGGTDREKERAKKWRDKRVNRQRLLQYRENNNNKGLCENRSFKS